MKRLAILLALVIPVIVLAQGAARPVRAPPTTVLFPAYAAQYTNALSIGCYASLEAPFKIEKFTGQITTGSGGGAGNTVVTATDGTNTCTFTLGCVASQSTGGHAIAAVNGAGTGCAYATGATVCASVTTAGCTSTQPTFRNALFLGDWL